MKHIEENDLVLYRYSEPCDRAGIARHLTECAFCRTRYDALERVLGAVAAPPVPARDEGYGARVWQRLRPRLEEPRGISGWREWLRPRRLLPVAAMAVLLLVAFLAGRFWPRPPVPVDVADAVSPQQVRERILLVEVGEHLERSRMILVELANAPSGGSLDISGKQERAEELVAASRLYRQTAAETGEAGVALVLEDLERLLLELARSPAELSPAALERFRERIEEQDILFKVHVVEFQVRERTRENPPEPAAAPERTRL